jgi:putative transposase
MSPSERKSMINRDRTDLSLTKQCKLLKINRSSLYYVPVGVNAETLELMRLIGCLPNTRSLAAAKSQLICRETGSMQAVTVCVV